MFFLGWNAFAHIFYLGWHQDVFETLLWIVAQPSAMAGCLGLFLIAKMTGRPGLLSAAKIASWVALICTIVFIVFVGFIDDYGRPTVRPDWLFTSAIMLVAFLIGGLPALLVDRIVSRKN